MDDDERKLIRAARMGDLDECKRIFRERNININARDVEKHTALFLASRGRHVSVVSWLLENGADVRVKSESDQTPLHAVCWSKQVDDPRMLEVARLLLEHGQDVNVLNRTGHAPLHWASYYGHVGLVRLLLEKGADASLINAEGETALDKARRGGNSAECRAIIALLEESGGLPVASFYGFLFDKEKMDQKRWHDGLVLAIDNVHDTKVFFTILKTSLILKMISKKEAAVYLQKAIVQTAKKVTSQESVATYEMFLSKCRKDSIVRDDPSFLLLDMTHPNHFPADIKYYIESVVTHSVQRTQDLEMGTNFHDLRQNLQILCDEMFTLHQYSEHDEDSEAFRVVSALDGNYMFRMKAQATIIMVMVLIKAMERGVDESLSVLYSEVSSRIVDFGDLEHIREIISKMPNESQSFEGPSVQSFVASLDKGIELAKKVILETRNGLRKSEDFDAVLREPDAFVVFSFVATIMHPSSYPPQKREIGVQGARQQTKNSVSTRAASAEPTARYEHVAAAQNAHGRSSRSRRRQKSTSRSRAAASLSPQRFSWRHSEKNKTSPAPKRGDSPGWSTWRSPFARTRSRSRSRSMDVTHSHSSSSPAIENGRHRKESQSPLRFWRSGSGKADRHRAGPKPSPDEPKRAPGMIVTPPIVRTNQDDADTPFDESPRIGASATKTFSMSSPSSNGDGVAQVVSTAAAATSSEVDQKDAERSEGRGRSPSITNRYGFRGRRERSSSLRRVSRSASPPENGKKPTATNDRDFTPQQHNLQFHQNSDVVVTPRENGSHHDDNHMATRSTGSSHRGRSPSRRPNGSLAGEESKTAESIPTAGSASRSSGRLIKIYRDAELAEQDELALELHAAVKFGDMELVEEFLSSDNLTDIQLNALDSCGRTALDLAALTGQIEVMTMIESRGGIYSYRTRDRMVKKAKKRARYVSQYLKLVGSDL